MTSRGPRGLACSETFLEYIETLREEWPARDEDESGYRAGNADSDRETLTT